MKEISVEEHLSLGVFERGGLCIKLNPFWYFGIPDRLVLMPGGWIAFVELKRPIGGRKGAKQKWWRELLIRLGFRHYWLKTKTEVDEFLEGAYK